MAQKLYCITTQFWSKDLNKKASLGYVVAYDEGRVANHISKKYCSGEWFGYEEDGADEVEVKRQDYIAHKGDGHTEYAGEFYDQKFGWEEVAEVTDEQISVLKTLGIVEELAV